MKPLDERFAMLERARPQPAGEDERAREHLHVSARFASVEPRASHGEAPPAPAPPPAPVAVTDRDPFAPPPELDAGYELAPRDARPTVRCAECGFENARSPHDCCGRCSAPLDSRAASHLNAQLAQDERAEQFAAQRQAIERRARAAQAELDRKRELMEGRDGPRQEVTSAWPAFDHLVVRVARGPAARWPMSMRRLLVVVMLGALFGGLFLITKSPIVGFVLGLVVTGGLCLVPT